MPVNINQYDSPYIRFSYDWTTPEKSPTKPYRNAQDIDAGVFLLNKQGEVIDESYYGQLASRDGSVQHRSEYVIGGDLIPQKNHKLEQVDVQLDAINHAIHYLVPFVLSPKPFSELIETLTFSITQPVTRELTVNHHEQDMSKVLGRFPKNNRMLIGLLARQENGDWVYANRHEPNVSSGELRGLHIETRAFIEMIDTETSILVNREDFHPTDQ